MTMLPCLPSSTRRLIRVKTLGDCVIKMCILFALVDKRVFAFSESTVADDLLLSTSAEASTFERNNAYDRMVINERDNSFTSIPKYAKVTTTEITEVMRTTDKNVLPNPTFLSSDNYILDNITNFIENKSDFPSNSNNRCISSNNQSCLETQACASLACSSTHIKQSNNSTGNKTKLYIGGLFDLTGNRDAELGQSELTAARLAVDGVNKDNVLPEYELVLLHNDTQVSKLYEVKTPIWCS